VIDTEMVDRLTAGMNMNKDDLYSLHPIGRLGGSRKLAKPCCGCAQAGVFVTGHGLIVDGRSPPANTSA
jgi:hypothetical protein